MKLFHMYNVQCQLGIKSISWGRLDFIKNGFHFFHVAFDAPTLMFHQTTLTSIGSFAMLADIRTFMLQAVILHVFFVGWLLSLACYLLCYWLWLNLMIQ